SAAIMSRSRFRPGRRTTADFTSDYLHLVVLNDGVCEQLLAHRLDIGLSLRLVSGVELEVENLALADRSNAIEAEGAECSLDRFTLRVENAVLERDGYASLDHDLVNPGRS